MIVLSIFMFPFIQFGFSWWVSISSFGCLLLLLNSVSKFKKSKLMPDNFTITVVLSMLLVYIWQNFGDVHSFLRISREALIFYLLIYFNHRATYFFPVRFSSKFDQCILFVVSLEFILVVCQFIALRQGIWIGPKAQWLAGRGNLIPTTLDLQYSKLRPSGTFSEPSYLGIICLSVLLLVGSEPLQTNIRKAIYSITLVTVIFSQSKSALFFGFLIVFLQRMRARKLTQTKLPSLALPLFLLLILPLISLISKTIESTRGSISIQNRIFDPLAYSAQLLLEHPLGVSFYSRIFGVVDSNSGLTWETISQNSIFNLIFSYGFVGLLILIRILLLVKKDVILLCYVFALLLQNGGYLDFDKLFLSTVVLLIYRNNSINAKST